MIDAIVWFLTNIAWGVVNFVRILISPSAWPNFGDMKWLVKFIYYGASVEFFFIVLDIAILILIIGLWRRSFLWGVVRGIETMNNTIGRVAAWAAFIMVIQQVLIVGLQRVFRVSEITIGPFGYTFTKDLSWFGEELKLYNAIIVTLAIGYTFVQGGHVRVDLFYAKMSFHGKRIIDMFGALFFVLPFMTIVWLFGWFFLWRNLVTPKVSALNTLAQIERKSGLMRWTVETIGFSPNGFNGYFLFKVLLVVMAGLTFLTGLAHFYRSLLEYLEGPDSEGKFKDPDSRYDLSGKTVELPQSLAKSGGVHGRDALTRTGTD